MSIESLYKRARRTPRRVALAEADDPRVLAAAVAARDAALAVPVLVGDPAATATLAASEGLDIRGIDIVDPARLPDDEALIAHARKRPGGREVSTARARSALASPLPLTMALCGAGWVDAAVAGATHTTAEVIGHASRYIPLRNDIGQLSSCFLMQLATAVDDVGALIMADCGLVVEPDEDALVNIAVAAAHSAMNLLEQSPRIAFLSFSTGGSARHASARRMHDAAERLARQQPDWEIVGEVQLDAAVDPRVLQRKAPLLQPLSGPANVMIFPSLDAGNIAYKLMQRFAGARPVGPILQGLSRPANDLSRGAGVEEIVDMIALSAVQSLDNTP